MKIVILDGYAENPGDLSWEWLGEYGEYTVYDRTPQYLSVPRAAILFSQIKLPLQGKHLKICRMSGI